MKAVVETFDDKVHTMDLAGHAARAAVVALAGNWSDAGEIFPRDVDDVIQLLAQWRGLIAVEVGE